MKLFHICHILLPVRLRSFAQVRVSSLENAYVCSITLLINVGYSFSVKHQFSMNPFNFDPRFLLT